MRVLSSLFRCNLHLILRSEIAGSNCKCIYIFARYCQIPLHRGCNILYSHQQWIRVPISPQACQQSAFSILNVCQSDKQDMVFQCNCNLHFSYYGEVEHFFICLRFFAFLFIGTLWSFTYFPTVVFFSSIVKSFSNIICKYFFCFFYFLNNIHGFLPCKMFFFNFSF